MSKLQIKAIFFISLVCCTNTYAAEPNAESSNTVKTEITDSPEPPETSEPSEDKTNWESAQKEENTIEAYEKYLAENPSGKYRLEAREALVDVAEKMLLDKKQDATDDDKKMACQAFKIGADNGSTRSKAYIKSPVCKELNEKKENSNAK